MVKATWALAGIIAGGASLVVAAAFVRRPKRDLAYQEQDLWNVLYEVSDDVHRQQAVEHRGVTCNNCKATPIRGIRFKCLHCIDYDLCFACDKEGAHPKTHLMAKISIPVPPAAASLRSLHVPNVYPNDNAMTEAGIDWDALREAKELGTGYTQVELVALMEQFQTVATQPQGVDRETFGTLYGPLALDATDILDRIFQFFDADGDGFVGFTDYIHGQAILTGNFDERCEAAFHCYDLSGSGVITKDDLYTVFAAYFQFSFNMVREYSNSVEAVMLQAYDPDGTSPVSAAFTMGISMPPDDAPADLAPALDTLVQDALPDLVERAFGEADLDGDNLISHEEFVVWATRDPNVIAWVSQVGTLF